MRSNDTSISEAPPQRILERDASISSTITVDPQLNKSLSEITFYAPSLPKQQDDNEKLIRHVRFDERSNQQHENHLYCEEDCHLLWHTDEQYSDFKSHTKSQIFAAIEAEFEEEEDPDSFVNVMSEVYHVCCTLAKEQEDEVKLATKANKKKGLLPSALRKRFAKMLAEPRNVWRLGLHSYALEFVKEGKEERRRTVAEVVLYLQEEYHAEDKKCVAQAMSEVCQNVTRPARLFSLCMAQALAATSNKR